MMYRAHYRIEKRSFALVLGILVVSAIGGLVEIAPLFTIDETVEEAPDMRVYTPLELAGRHLYIREGCYACHSQMIRTLRDEVDRYGPFSLAVESQYDHPMLWGSKRTGPDLARVGEKYSDLWHVRHLNDPREVVPESIMPAYAWLSRNELRVDDLTGHLRAMRRVGVPYTDAMIENAAADARAQATPAALDVAAGSDELPADELRARYGEATNVRAFDGDPQRLTEMDAMVAYLQILGRLTDAATRPVDGPGLPGVAPERDEPDGTAAVPAADESARAAPAGAGPLVDDVGDVAAPTTRSAFAGTALAAGTVGPPAAGDVSEGAPTGALR